MWDGILNGCASVLYELAKLVGDWGLAIIIVTLIIRLLLFPLQRKQLKSSFQMQQVQPRMQEIQTLYAGDQVKIQQEMQKLYQETGFNPLAGCLPMLIQMPIFIILFQVLRDKIGQYAGGDPAISFYNILPNLTQTVPDAFNQGVTYAIPYIIFMLLFIGLSIAPMLIQLRQNQQNKSQMTMMLGLMGIMFGCPSSRRQVSCCIGRFPPPLALRNNSLRSAYLKRRLRKRKRQHPPNPSR